MGKKGFLIVAAVAVATLLYLVFVAATYEAPQGTTTVVIPAQVEAPEPIVRPIPSRPEVVTPAIQDIEAEPEPTEVEAPAIVAEPLETAALEAEQVIELPSLNDSDSFVFEGLRNLQNGAALLRVIAQEQLVRKFVVFVENVSRGEFPQTELPYRAVEQEMQVREVDDGLFVMEQISHQRFDQFINLLVSMDSDEAMSFYRMLSPLFQQAYAEIGFRNVNFDSTLRRAITNVLQTTDVEGPHQLVKPSVMYVYADASVENLQEVHKQLIRIGPENTENVKAKLREVLTRL